MHTSKLALATLIATGLMASSAFAASAKFAAHVTDSQLLSTSADSSKAGPAAPESATILNTTIRTPSKKDLLMGVSLEIGLYTDTQVKGKNGSSELASAEGGGQGYRTG